MPETTKDTKEFNVSLSIESCARILAAAVFAGTTVEELLRDIVESLTDLTHVDIFSCNLRKNFAARYYTRTNKGNFLPFLIEHGKQDEFIERYEEIERLRKGGGGGDRLAELIAENKVLYMQYVDGGGEQEKKAALKDIKEYSGKRQEILGEAACNGR